MRFPIDVPLLEGPSGALARAGAGDAKLFSLSGRRATAWGSGLKGLAEVQGGGWTLVSELEAGLGPASNVVVDPASVRREVTRHEVTVLETLLLALRAPAAILQWRLPDGGAAPLSLELRWKLACADGAELSFEVIEPLRDRVRVLARPPRSDLPAPCAFVAVHPAPVWELLAEDGALRATAKVKGDPGGAVSLLVAGGATEQEALAALQVAAAARTEEVRAEQALQRARQEGLATHTGVAALDEGIEWAKARIRGAVVEETQRPEVFAATGASARGSFSRSIRRVGGPCRGHPQISTRGSGHGIQAGAAAVSEDATAVSVAPSSPRVEEVWIALGALAAGDPEPAEIVLEGDLPTLYHLLLAGRYVAWTGDGEKLLSLGGRLDAAVARNAKSHPRAVAAAAFHGLADAWESCSEKKRATFVRSLADGIPVASREGGRRLPVVGSTGGPSADEALAGALLGVDSKVFYRPPAAPPVKSLDRALRAWALGRSGDPEDGYRALREHIESGFHGGWGVWNEAIETSIPRLFRGSSADACPDHTASAALVPGALLFGMLGATADAPVGRLRLAPRFPSAWSKFDVTGIRMGDALVSLRYQRDGNAHSYRLRQDGGRLPVMLVFEPEVPETDVESVRVDGAAADLSQARARGRTSVRVQLPLDREREITLVGKRIAGTP